MSGSDTAHLVIALTAFATVAAGLSWSRYGQSVWAPVTVLALAAAAVVASVAENLTVDRVSTTVLVALAATLAVAGGGPLTTRVFTLVDRADVRADARAGIAESGNTLDQAGAVLRGGAWIGALERLAVYAGLAAGFPEGVAVVLALKGVGRFPDLRESGGNGATERFIIGTLTSVLWAAGCAGLVALVSG